MKSQDNPKCYSSMRSYYFGVVLPPFLEKLGYDPEDVEEVHRQLKIAYFGVKSDKRGVYRKKDIPNVFSDGSTILQETRIKFLEWVIRKAGEYGVSIPNTEEK